jgi:D-3-phosphoglycerate dehydrogenase
LKKRVLITCRQLQETIEPYRGVLAENGFEIELPAVVQQLREPELLEIIDGFDGIIAGDDELTARVLERGNRLKVIAKWGVGMDAIDLEAARRLGIRVFNTPGVFADEVADVVMGYMILLARQLHKVDQSVRNGGWMKIRGVSLRDKILGVVGIGDIGRAVVRRAVASGMSVIGYDIASVPTGFNHETRLRVVELEELLKTADFISLNCSLTPTNHHLLGSRQFALMKDGVYIVNTARGGLIDEAALVGALRRGKVSGVALDVFENEPLPPNSPLREFDNCIFGTHNSSNTVEAVSRVNAMTIQNLLSGLDLSGSE